MVKWPPGYRSKMSLFELTSVAVTDLKMTLISQK